MKKHLLLYLSLICVRSITLSISVDAQALKIRMYPHKFNSILQTESFNELKSMSSTERKKLWRLSSIEHFRDGICVGESHPCAIPYIVCDSTPGQTGFDRQQSLRSMIKDQAPGGEKRYVEIGTTPLINISDVATSETCYIASMTPKTARKVSIKSCPDENNNCLIHPILPMMKLAYGTVSDVTEIIEAQDVHEILLRIEISPFNANKEFLVLEDFIKSTIKLSEDNCSSHLEETFPTSNKKMNLGCTHSLKLSEINGYWVSTSRSTAELYLIPSNEGLMTNKELTQKILLFIAGLAARPEVTQIELSYYYFIGFND